MKHALLISPHFPPTNAADHQRVRQSLPYWRELGWEPHVIAVHARGVAAPLDPFLERTLPKDVGITRVNALSLAWSRIPGLGTLGFRCQRAIWCAIRDRLNSTPVDDETVVYFSTTQFAVMHLIPRIRRRWPRVAMVIDYQDPWLSDFYRMNPQIRPPGGRLKYAFVRRMAQWHEPRALRATDGITSVSPSYIETLHQRYAFARQTPAMTLPFAAAEQDFTSLREFSGAKAAFDRVPGWRNWVYVGRGGADMAAACRGLFRAIKCARNTDPRWAKVRMHFIGTDYAPPERARASIAPVADEEGIGDQVTEQPVRVSYATALQSMLEADALILPGSIDPAYTASKVYPYILARKPLLAVVHERSPMRDVMVNTRGGVVATFTEESTTDDLAKQIASRWLHANQWETPPDTDWDAFAPFTARCMTEQLSKLFDKASAHRIGNVT